MTEQEVIQVYNNILILPQLKNLIRPLTSEEYNQLEQNLLSEGIRDSIILWQTTNKNYYELCGKLPAGFETDHEVKELEEACYILVDGHNRYSIAQKHKNLDIPFEIRVFRDFEAVQNFMINLQLGRRNATPEEQSYYRGLQYKNEKSTHGGNREASYQNDNLTGKKTIERVAEAHKVSPATISRDEKFFEAIELIKSIDKNLAWKILNKDINVSKIDLYTLQEASEQGFLLTESHLNRGLIHVFNMAKMYIHKPTPKQKENDFWKKQAKAEKPKPQSLFEAEPEPEQEATKEQDFFDRVGEQESKEDFESLYKAVFKEAEYYRERMNFFASQLENLQDVNVIAENNELKQKLSDLQKDFKTSTVSDRIKIAETGLNLCRANSYKNKHIISQFLRNDDNLFEWREIERFETKAELDVRVLELRCINNIIFE